MYIVIRALKSFINPETLEFLTDSTSTVLREIIVDFLYRLKDKHPFSTLIFFKYLGSIDVGSFDVFDLIMEFLIPSGLQPSASLYLEYARSEVTKMLNTLQTREFYNEKFDSDFQMSEETYDRLKERYIKKVSYLHYV